MRYLSSPMLPCTGSGRILYRDFLQAHLENEVDRTVRQARAIHLNRTPRLRVTASLAWPPRAHGCERERMSSPLVHGFRRRPRDSRVSVLLPAQDIANDVDYQKDKQNLGHLPAKPKPKPATLTHGHFHAFDKGEEPFA